jgi:ribosomal protein L11 methyltransferase
VIRLAVRVHRRHADLVLAELLELAPSGVEEVEVSSEVIEYAVYGAPGELPAVPDLRAAAGGAYVDVITREIADDWSERWRSFHRPLVISDRLTVRPPWEPPGTTALDVVVDPGQAFGTGAHATTRLCLELMLDLDASGDRAGRSLVDIGCGSGVLAIVAAKLGLAPVIALDYDRAATAATRENAARNGVELDIRDFDMRNDQAPACDYGVANVLGGPLISWAAFQRELPPVLILSGLLAVEADRVAEAYAARGLAERERRLAGEWGALLVARG